MMDYEDDEFGELYVDNLRSYSSSPQKSTHTPNFNNVDGKFEQVNNGKKELENEELAEPRVLNCSELDSETNLIRESPNLNNVEGIKLENDREIELEQPRGLNCSELDLETNLIRVLINSYGLSPIESSGDGKGGDLTDDLAFDVESGIIEQANECKDLNLGCMENDLGVIRDFEGFGKESLIRSVDCTDIFSFQENRENEVDMRGFKSENSCGNGKECDEDNESGDSLVIILNNDFNSMQVDLDEKVEDGKDMGVEEENLHNDLSIESSGELGNAEGARVGDHSTNSMNKSVRPVPVAIPGITPVVPRVPAASQCVRPIAGIKLGGASTSSFVLPLHMRVFDVNIDNFEEKKWRRPSADESDFFNYGLDEEKWKDYCKQMEQLRLESSMKTSKLAIYESGQSEKNYDRDLDSNFTVARGIRDPAAKNISAAVKTESIGEDFETANEMSPSPIGRAIEVEIGTCERLPCIGAAKPSRVRGLGAIIEIVSQDSIDESDLKKEDFKEDLGPLDCKHHNNLPHDHGSRSSTVHKNIHGDGILPFPLDGSSRHCPDEIFDTRHQERGDYSPRIKDRADYQHCDKHKSWWQKDKNGKWRIKEPYEDNQPNTVKERWWDYEEHKRIITKGKALKMIHQNTLPPTKRTPYHPTTYGNCKVRNDGPISQISKNRPTWAAFNNVQEIPKQWNSKRRIDYYITSNSYDSIRGKWCKPNGPDHYSTGSPEATATKEDAEKLKMRSKRFTLPVSNEKEHPNEESKSLVLLIRNDSAEDSEIKHPRPVRKRRWVSS